MISSRMCGGSEESVGLPFVLRLTAVKTERPGLDGWLEAGYGGGGEYMSTFSSMIILLL